MTDTHAEKAQYWCFDGSSWRHIDDPLPPGDLGGDSLFEMYGQFGFELLLGPDDTDGHGAYISLWTRKTEPQCLIDIFHGGDGDGLATVYADRLPDGIELFTRWAPAIYGYGGQSKPSA